MTHGCERLYRRENCSPYSPLLHLERQPLMSAPSGHSAPFHTLRSVQLENPKVNVNIRYDGTLIIAVARIPPHN